LQKFAEPFYAAKHRIFSFSKWAKSVNVRFKPPQSEIAHQMVDFIELKAFDEASEKSKNTVKSTAKAGINPILP